jgi:acetylglutamate kinase
MEVVQMVLGGEINKNLSDMLNSYGARAVGLSGKDGIAKAKSKCEKTFKYTGEITKISNKIIKKMLKENIIPVIAPLASSSNNSFKNNNNYHLGFNINADVFATHLAVSLKAEKIFFLTNTKGVLDSDGNLLETLDVAQTKKLIKNKTINGGMMPKVDSCLYSINNGVTKAHIIDGSKAHGIILELLTNKGSGTQFVL